MDDLFKLLFKFQGRINRAPYWIAVCIYLAVLLVLGTLIYITDTEFSLFFFVALVIYIPMIVSGIAVGLKRLHDRDKSGWWLLVFYVGPAVLSGSGNAIGANFIFSLASFALSIWGLVELGFLRGTAGPNRYGPDPLQS